MENSKNRTFGGWSILDSEENEVANFNSYGKAYYFLKKNNLKDCQIFRKYYA